MSVVFNRGKTQLILKPCLISETGLFLDEYVTIRVMQATVVRDAQAQVERAGSVPQYANDSKSTQGA